MPINPQITPISPTGRSADAIAELRRRIAVLERGSSGGGGGGTVEDATTSIKGKIQLSGDLGGTAGSPTVIDATTTAKGKVQLAGDVAPTSTASNIVIEKASTNFKIKGPRPWIDVTHPDYGADPTGVAGDMGVIINAAVAALPSTGGEIRIPAGTYRQTTTADLTGKPVTLVGAGFSGSAAVLAWNPVTEIKWAGTNGTMVKFGLTQGGGVRGIGFNGGGASGALIGIDCDRCYEADFDGVGIYDLNTGASTGISLHTGSTTTATDNCHFNHFRAIFISATNGVKWDGVEPTTPANTCHNVFDGLTIVYGRSGSTSYGLDAQDSDNNYVSRFFAFQRSGDTGYAIRFGDHARSNYFYHVQANGGVYVTAPADAATDSNELHGYDRSNGQPQPTIAAGAQLDWKEIGSNSAGTYENCGDASPATSGHRTHKLAHRTGAEFFATGTGNSSLATFDAWGKDSGGTLVRGFLRAGGASALVRIGSISNHAVSILQNNAEVAQFTTSGNFALATGKRISGGDGIVVKVASTINDAAYTTPTNGMLGIQTSDNTLRYRVGTDDWRAPAAGAPSNPFTVTGTTLSQIIADATSNSSDAYLETKAKTSGGTLVHGQIRSGLGGSFIISATSLHPIKFFVQGTESFQVTTSRHVFVQAGNRVGIGVDPSAALHFAASTTDTDGLQFGADATPIRQYRAGTGIVRLDASAGLGFGLSASGSSSTVGAFLANPTVNPFFDFVRSAGASNIIRGFVTGDAAAGTANRMALRMDGLLLGPGGATSPDTALKRSAANTLTLDNNAGAGITLSFLDGTQSAIIEAGTTNGLKIGSASTKLLGLWGATPVARPAAIADASGGAVADTQARAAINALLAANRSVGFIAT